MNDEDFTRLVERAGATTVVRTETLNRVVDDARAVHSPIRRRRRPVVIGAAIAGAVLLAAAASSSYWTKIPPFQSLDDGMYRTHLAIPVDFAMVSGQQVHCEAFLEYENLSVAQADQAEAFVKDQDWSGFGQRLYDDGASASESYEDAQTRLYDALAPILRYDAHVAVPSAIGPSDQAELHHRALVSGSSAVCRRVAK